jgi:hypothetical protein
MAIYVLQNKGNQLKEDGTYEIEAKLNSFMENCGKAVHFEEVKQSQEYEEEEKKDKEGKTQHETFLVD